MIEINAERIRKTDVSFLDKYFHRKGHVANAFSENFPSIEHYKLLTDLSFQFNDITILDMGTSEGVSAICLSCNLTNRVISYDIVDMINPEYNKYPVDRPNIECKIMDVNDEQDVILLSASLIFVDISHNGTDEQKLSDKLTKIGWKGFLLCDDIRSFPPVRHWFINLPYKKYDLTEVGHYSGTGLVDFSKLL